MYYNEELEEIYKKLESNKNGLKLDEVDRRIEKNGYRLSRRNRTT